MCVEGAALSFQEDVCFVSKSSPS